MTEIEKSRFKEVWRYIQTDCVSCPARNLCYQLYKDEKHKDCTATVIKWIEKGNK